MEVPRSPPPPAPGDLWPAPSPSPQPRPVRWTGLKGVREGATWDSGSTAPNGRARRSCQEARGGGWQGGAPGSPASVPRCPSRRGAWAPHLCSAASPRRPAAGGPRGPRGSGLGRAALTVRVGQDAGRRPGAGRGGGADSLTGHGVWQERAQRHRAAGREGRAWSVTGRAALRSSKPQLSWLNGQEHPCPSRTEQEKAPNHPEAWRGTCATAVCRPWEPWL